MTARLEDAGIHHDGPREVTESRVVELEDPDGNRLVFTGPSR